MAAGASVEIDIREKRFENLDRPLFAGLELSIAPAATVALVGPSGVGKSTLLRMIAGIDRDYDGRIRIDGAAAHSAPTPGFVFQDPRLLPWLTASANIRAVRPDIGEDRAAELLHEVGLGGYEKALPHQLSGGMQRRVALARALSIEPQLLLLDEPFVSLDKTLAHDLHRVFRRMVDAYRPTVVVVSHEADDAARLAERVVILGGRPAAVVRELTLDVPPAERGPAEIDKAADKVSEAMENVT